MTRWLARWRAATRVLKRAGSHHIRKARGFLKRAYVPGGKSLAWPIRAIQGEEVNIQDVGGADSLVLPEIASLVRDRLLQNADSCASRARSGRPIESIDSEFCPSPVTSPTICGFTRAWSPASTVALPWNAAAEMRKRVQGPSPPGSVNSAYRKVHAAAPAIKVSVLDTGMDLGNPDFSGRSIVSQTFVGQPVQDRHTTHDCIGKPADARPAAHAALGVAHKALIFAGKVLPIQARRAGWHPCRNERAIANSARHFDVPCSRLGHPPHASGQSALNNVCLIIAAAGNAGRSRRAGESPHQSVSSLDPTFGFNLLQRWQDESPRPGAMCSRRYRARSDMEHGGTSMRRPTSPASPTLAKPARVARHDPLEQLLALPGRSGFPIKSVVGGVQSP